MPIETLHYQTQEEDYIALSLFLMRRDDKLGRRIALLRWGGTAAILLICTVVSMARERFSLPSLLVFALIAAVYCISIPLSVRHNVAQSVRASISSSAVSPCGEKTLRVRNDDLQLQDAAGETVLPFDELSAVATDEKAHLFVLTGSGIALTIPFTAFEDEEARQAFYSALLQHVKR